MQTDEKLEKRIAYEKMLAEISERALFFHDLSIFLNESLNSMGQVLDVSRIFIFNYQLSKKAFCCVCRWGAPGTGTTKELDEQPLFIPWTTEQLLAGRVVNFQYAWEIPGESDRKRLLAAKVKSTLSVPLFVKGEFYGFVGFDECRFHRKWVDEDVYILTTAAQIITRAIERKRYEETIEQHRKRLELIFTSVQDAIIMVDDSMNVLEANIAADHICGIKIIRGKPFGESIRGCDKSCIRLLEETLKTKKTIPDYRIECRRHDQRKMVAIMNCSPVLNLDSSFSGAVLVIRDVTRLTRLEEELQERQQYKNIVGHSEEMQKIYNLVKILANLRTTVLITGESGTGKEMVARALHNAGVRASQPFVTVNCSALPENLLENELFGHVKGAFTGADKDTIGRFEMANGGTILLDEIGDISPLIQLKLLRVLQERQFERLGESKPREVNARIIAATNRDLKQAIKAGAFREDLYYRLNVMNIRIPPLRERYGDVPLLIDHFCRKFNKEYEKAIKGVSDEVMETFINYPWPGNIRELEHAIERAFVLCQDRTILLAHIPIEIREYNLYKRQQYRSHSKPDDDPNKLIDTLEMTDWNISKAARILGVSRWTIYRRLKQQDLTRPAT